MPSGTRRPYKLRKQTLPKKPTTPLQLAEADQRQLKKIQARLRKNAWQRRKRNPSGNPVGRPKKAALATQSPLSNPSRLSHPNQTGLRLTRPMPTDSWTLRAKSGEVTIKKPWTTCPTIRNFNKTTEDYEVLPRGVVKCQGITFIQVSKK